MPLSPLLIIVTAIAVVAGGFWYLKTTATNQIDVSWIHYPNTAIVYGLWVGFILMFMLFSLKKPTRFPERPPRTRFLCLIPAYNEVSVIGNSVVSLLGQDYPESLVEVVVVFDGTDRTGELARKLGAAVVETPSPRSGKHRALAYAIGRLTEDDDDRYVCVFDADTVVSKDFLRRMNDAILGGGHRCLQGFHDVLNRQDNWVTKALWCATTASSRLYNQGRYNSLGNALICGTGWCCEGKLLNKYWPAVRTQTEDIELGGLLLLNEGIRVAWVAEARMYDEKPRNIWVAARQRRRWMVGHMRVFWYLAWPCLKGAVRRGDIALLEISLYYAVPLAMSISVIQLFGVHMGISLGVFSVAGPLASPAAQISLGAVTVFFILGYQIVGFGLDERRWAKGALYAIYALVFSLIAWTIALVWSWFSLCRSDWMSHTPHVTRAAGWKHSLSKT